MTSKDDLRVASVRERIDAAAPLERLVQGDECVIMTPSHPLWEWALTPMHQAEESCVHVPDLVPLPAYLTMARPGVLLCRECVERELVASGAACACCWSAGVSVQLVRVPMGGVARRLKSEVWLGLCSRCLAVEL